MNPKNKETKNSEVDIENLNKGGSKKEVNEEKYKPIELEQNQNTSMPPPVQTPVTNPVSNTPVPIPAPVDPVQQVKNMISAGYTPSLDLIQNASNLIKSNNSDYSDVWFAILLQKLIRKYKS